MNHLNLQPITRETLIKTFEEIRYAVYQGIPGVLKFDSGNPGPTLGITIQTHGNEPSGLATLRHFLGADPIQKILKMGKVVFVLNNIAATEKFFLAKTEEEKRQARFVDINLNRLPKDAMELVNDTRYEIRRAQELREIWGSFDVGLDIHSTTQESEPMIVAVRKFEKDLVRGFPIGIVLSAIEDVQIGLPATAFYGGRRVIPVLGIETGSHEHPASFRTAVNCVYHLLRNLAMIPKEEGGTQKRKYLIYKVYGALMFQDSSYALTRVFRMFEPVSKGCIMATGDGQPLLAPVTGHAIFGPADVRPPNILDEVLFFTEPATEVEV